MMSTFTGNAIFFSVTAAAGLAVFIGIVWGLFLGFITNRKSSGSRNIYKNRFQIKGTVDDTLTQVEKEIRELYRAPMEIDRQDTSVSFVRVLKQNIFSVFKKPFESITFETEEMPGNLVNITYSVNLKRLRVTAMLASFAFLMLITVPACTLIIRSVWTVYMPSFLIQGDIIPEVAYSRKGVLYIFNVLHFLWPPFIPLFAFHAVPIRIRREFNRFLENIEYIE